MATVKICRSVITLIAALSVISCDQSIPAQTTAPQAEKPIAVTSMVATASSWAPTVDSFGRVESTEEVKIGIEFSGLVKVIKFQEGDTIKAGQLLIKLDDQKQQLRYEQADANVNRARAELNRAQSTHQRYRSLLASNVLSKEQFNTAESAFNAGKAALQQAQAARALALRELNETTIISPVDGIVKAREIEIEQTVLPGQTLAIVQATNTMRIVSYVTEKEVNSLQIGSQSPITSPGVPGHVYQGRIETIGSSADLRTGNFTVKLTVNNQNGLLRDGMSARVSLRGIEQPNTLLIPRNAIVDRDRKQVLYRMKDNRAEEIEPVIGIGDGDHIAILAGIQAGDQIIMSPLDLIANGRLVERLVTTTDTDSHDEQLAR